MTHRQTPSELLVFAADPSLANSVEAALVPLGWCCSREDSLTAALDRLSAAVPAAVLVDGEAPQAEAMAAAIRQLAAPLNGTPILTVGESVNAGPGGHLDKPLVESALRELLARWAGPLEDHGLRAAPWTPRYRLIRLLGRDGADALLRRLRDALAEAVGEEKPPAHRLAGVAGLCGYVDLADAWLRVDHGEDEAWPAARAASHAVIEDIDGALGSV